MVMILEGDVQAGIAPLVSAALAHHVGVVVVIEVHALDSLKIEDPFNPLNKQDEPTNPNALRLALSQKTWLFKRSVGMKSRSLARKRSV